MKKMIFGATLFLRGVLLVSSVIIASSDAFFAIAGIIIGICGAAIMAYDAFYKK